MSNALDHYQPSDIIDIGFTPISGLADRCYSQTIGNARLVLDIASDGYLNINWIESRGTFKPYAVTIIAYRNVHSNLWTCGDIDDNTPMSLDDIRLALIREYNWRHYGI